MRLRTLSICIGAAPVALSLVSVAGAGATSTSPANSQLASLKRVGVSWATYANNGNGPKACELQVEPNVGGLPCDQVPTYSEALYCPAFPQGEDDSSWRDATERIAKVKVNDKTGSMIIRASAKGSKKSGKASFQKVGGKWRIVSFQSKGQKFAPAGLIFTEGNELRKELWPLHC
jgi:hypothetical protein